MNRFRKLALAAASIAVLSAGSAVNAGILYDNLGVASGGSAHVSFSDNGPLADSFFTGGSAASLSNVVLLLGADAPSDGGSLSVDLLSDSSIHPSSNLIHLGTVDDSSLTTSPSAVDLSLATPYLLAANTRYWIEVSGTSTSGIWSFATNDSGIGVAGEYNFYAGAVQPNTMFTPYQMEVNTVPEPGTLVLSVIGITILAFARRRLA